MKNHLTILICVACVAISCETVSKIGNQKVRLVSPDREEVLSKDNAFTGLGIDNMHAIALQIVSDSILVVQLQPTEETPEFFHAFSLRTMSSLGFFGKKGRGPGELISPHIAKKMSGTKTMSVSENSLAKAFNIDVQASIGTKTMVLSKESVVPQVSVDWIPLGDSSQLTLCMEQDEFIFQVFGEKGTVVQTIRPYKGIDAQQKAPYLSGLITGNASGDQAAVCLVCFPQVLYMDTITGQITAIAVDSEYKHWESTLNTMFGPQTIEYYCSITPSRDYLIAAYKGYSIGEGMTGSHGTQIHVFDWNGRFMHRISVSETLSDVCFDSSSRLLYAIDSSEGSIVRYDLSSLL